MRITGEERAVDDRVRVEVRLAEAVGPGRGNGQGLRRIVAIDGGDVVVEEVLVDAVGPAATAGVIGNETESSRAVRGKHDAVLDPDRNGALRKIARAAVDFDRLEWPTVNAVLEQLVAAVRLGR
jgi:hypothetical protein